MTLIRFSPSSLREGRWYEYLIRFALGGAVTVFTGLISSRYGPSVGGLFLALPAIFCASATLIEKHEIRRKREAGFAGERRGPRSAANGDETHAASASHSHGINKVFPDLGPEPLVSLIVTEDFRERQPTTNLGRSNFQLVFVPLPPPSGLATCQRDSFAGMLHAGAETGPAARIRTGHRPQPQNFSPAS